MEVKDVSDLFTSTVIGSKKPFLVYFSAKWCGPCRAVKPLVEEIAEERSDTLSVGKINVDYAPELTTKYGIRAIPALILFVKGKPVDQLSGSVPKAKIEAMLDEHLS